MPIRSWNIGISQQVGHFLSAVHAASWGKIGKRFAIGHEQIGDNVSISKYDLYNVPTENDLAIWDKAIEADRQGDILMRDRLLWILLRFDDKTVSYEDVDKNRPGNSLQDLRLSLKGFRFNDWINENPQSSPSQAGVWLYSHLMVPFGHPGPK